MSNDSQDAFDQSVTEAIADLPAWARPALRGIDIVLQDWPGDEAREIAAGVLADAETADESQAARLLGLYVGTPISEREPTPSGVLSDVIYLYREPHRALGLKPLALKQEIARTLIHELGHHFGFDEHDLEDHGFA